MPVYEYKCECSEDKVAFNMSIKDYVETQPCEKCGKDMKRFYTPVGAKFNGPGFYSTDNRK